MAEKFVLPLTLPANVLICGESGMTNAESQ